MNSNAADMQVAQLINSFMEMKSRFLVNILVFGGALGLSFFNILPAISFSLFLSQIFLIMVIQAAIPIIAGFFKGLAIGFMGMNQEDTFNFLFDEKSTLISCVLGSVDKIFNGAI